MKNYLNHQSIACVANNAFMFPVCMVIFKNCYSIADDLNKIFICATSTSF